MYPPHAIRTHLLTTDRMQGILFIYILNYEKHDNLLATRLYAC